MPNKNIYVDLSLNKNELQNAVVQNLSSAPSQPKAGQIYYNTVDKLLYIYDGSSWIAGKSYSAGTGLTLTDTTFSVNTSVIAQKSDIGAGILTLQKNGTDIDSFSANASSNKSINIIVPTTAADVSALPASTKYGATFTASMDSSTYVMTLTLKDQDGNTLGTAQTIDLPLESVVVGGSYDSTNKKIILTLENGQTIDIPVADLISGLQSEITSSNKLSADLVDDTSTTNKFVTASQKAAIDTALQPADIVGMAKKITATNPALTESSGVCTWNISNTLATADVVVSIYDTSNNEEIFASVTTGSSTITIKFNADADIAVGTYKAVIVG